MLDNLIIFAYCISVTLVIYHHLVYPLLLGLLSKIKVNDCIQGPNIRVRNYLKSEEDVDSQSYSIVIPAFNESKYITETINNLDKSIGY